MVRASHIQNTCTPYIINFVFVCFLKHMHVSTSEVKEVMRLASKITSISFQCDMDSSNELFVPKGPCKFKYSDPLKLP